MTTRTNRSTRSSGQSDGRYHSSSGFSITQKEFDLFRELIYSQTGISLADHKRELIVSRLSRRLRSLKLNSFQEYFNYLSDPASAEAEMGQLINRITTNKTDFYREKHHFDFMSEVALPELIAEKAAAGQKKIRAWSSASSTGEEPYTIAVTLCEFFADKPGWDVKLLATDLDTEVLAHASRGVYAPDRVAPVPKNLLTKYFDRVTDNGRPAYRTRQNLRQLITFRKFNLMSENFPFKVQLDFIFCRNVMIYFNMEDKVKLLTKFHRVLKPNGYIMVGHSESLMMVKHLYRYVKNTVYQKI